MALIQISANPKTETDGPVKLGVVAVLDVERLAIGSHTTIEDRLFVVADILGPKVILRPVTGLELLIYQIRRLFRDLLQ